MNLQNIYFINDHAKKTYEKFVKKHPNLSEQLDEILSSLSKYPFSGEKLKNTNIAVIAKQGIYKKEFGNGYRIVYVPKLPYGIEIIEISGHQEYENNFV